MRNANMNLNKFSNEKAFEKIYSKDIINIKQYFIESGVRSINGEHIRKLGLL